MKAMYFIKFRRLDGEITVSQRMSARVALLFFNSLKGNREVSIYKVGEDLPKRVHLFNV